MDTSRRWRGSSTPSSRRNHGDNVASTAWGARNLISTQLLTLQREHLHFFQEGGRRVVPRERCPAADADLLAHDVDLDLALYRWQ